MDTKISVLIADGNEYFCEQLAAALKKQPQFNVVGSYTNGNNVVHAILNKRPDAVILDLMMPGTDGIAILQALCRNHVETTILATTTVTSNYVCRSASSLGVDYLMSKPCDCYAVVKRLNEFFTKEEQESRSQHEANLYTAASIILREFSVPAHLKGYQYLRSAMILASQNPEYVNGITKILYPQIAKEFGSTPSRVERTMRTAITAAWNHNSIEKKVELMGPIGNKLENRPTNTRFVSALAEALKAFPLEEMEA